APRAPLAGPPPAPPPGPLQGRGAARNNNAAPVGVQRLVRPQGNTPMAFRLHDSTTSPLVPLRTSSRSSNSPVFASAATASFPALIGPASRHRRNAPSFVGA